MASVEKYPAVKKMHDAVMDCADEALAKPPVTRQMVGIRLLETSRESLKRVFALSYAYRMTEDMRYARRAEKEMLACCEFSDWNPSHFLDVAEMSVSMSIGYDWLYDVLSMETRAKVERAVFEKAFKPVETEAQPWYGWTSNWNSVCNAGMTAAAVVFYDINPELCGSIILRSLESNPKAMAVYAPDGGSFIYERDSVRWALDLGMQDYGSLERYGLDIWNLGQGSDRWRVFRYGNMGHNTVSVLNSLHCVSGRAEITDTMASVSWKGVVVDLSGLLPQFGKVTRTACLDPEDNLYIEDVFESGDSPQTVVWRMNTEAVPEIVSEDVVRLTCRGHEMLVKFRTTSPFCLEIRPAVPLAEYDAPNPGVTQVCLLMDTGIGTAERIEVRFRNGDNAERDF